MKSVKPPRWRRVAERRRAAVRRMLAAGALVGVLGGVLGQLAVRGNVDPEIVPLVRFVLLLPAAIFVGWWLAFPGLSLQRDVPNVEVSGPTIDVDQRLERIEQAFDSTAVPGARRRSLLPQDASATALFRRSLRRTGSTSPAEHERFGIRRPDSDESRQGRG